MKTVAKLICCLCLLAILPVQAQTCDNLDQLQWLVGDWKSDRKNGVVLESWEQTSPLTFEGVGITLSKAGDEIDREWLRLLSMKNQIFYLAKVDHNSLPVPFQLTLCQPNRLIFQNPQHDFPKVITYYQKDESRLTVTISDGEARSTVFEFIKQ